MPDNTEVLVAIARLEGKVDALADKVESHLNADTVVHVDHEKRIRANERGRWLHTGVASVLGSIVTGFAAWMKFGGGN